jgi:hypothetical protein
MPLSHAGDPCHDPLARPKVAAPSAKMSGNLAAIMLMISARCTGGRQWLVYARRKRQVGSSRIIIAVVDGGGKGERLADHARRSPEMKGTRELGVGQGSKRLGDTCRATGGAFRL